MKSLRGSLGDFVVMPEEEEKLDKISSSVVALIKENNLTYIQALEVLVQCKVKIQMSLIK